MTFAIRATAVKLGEREVSHDELAAAHGATADLVATALEGKIVYATTTSRIALACDAAQQCLAKAGITIDDIDLLISCRGRTPEREPPLELALGRPQVPSLSVQGACPIILRAIWLARSWLQTEKLRRALVVYAETSNPNGRVIGQLAANSVRDIFSDGAVAVLVNDGPGLLLRAFASEESSEWWDSIGEPSSIGEQTELRALRESVAVSKVAFARCLERAGLTSDTVTALVMPNEADAMLRFVLRQLRMPQARLFRSARSPSRTWAVDPIFNLEHLLAAGTLSPGNVVMCGARAMGGAAFLALEVPSSS